MRFTTQRLVAEPLHDEHWGALSTMHRDPAMMASLGGVRDEPQTQEYYIRNQEHWRRNGFGLWMLRLRASGAIVGRVALRHLEVEGADEVELGYGLLSSFWGLGLATEATAGTLDYAKACLKLHSIVGLVLPGNAASIRVLEKTGFKYERSAMHADLEHRLYRRP
jgi:RimJ/RimL family protein N-acetyltransferase